MKEEVVVVRSVGELATGCFLIALVEIRTRRLSTTTTRKFLSWCVDQGNHFASLSLPLTPS